MILVPLPSKEYLHLSLNHLIFTHPRANTCNRVGTAGVSDSLGSSFWFWIGTAFPVEPSEKDIPVFVSFRPPFRHCSTESSFFGFGFLKGLAGKPKALLYGITQILTACLEIVSVSFRKRIRPPPVQKCNKRHKSKKSSRCFSKI